MVKIEEEHEIKENQYQILDFPNLKKNSAN